MVKCFDTDDELAMKIYTDQTGRFPKQSLKGNQYIMVLCEVDSNAILVEPMKNRSADEMICAFQHLIDRLKGCGAKPKHLILNNEISAAFKSVVGTNEMTYQLVPPNDPRQNIAGRAI